MEANDIVQEFAQTQTQAQESSLESTSVESVAPEQAIAQSAYEALLTGKPQEKPVEQMVAETTISDETTTVDTEIDVTVESSESLQVYDEQSGIDDIIDEDDFIKSKTDGRFESWEEVIEALENIQKPSFENETSEQLYNLIAEGRIDDVVETLAARKFAEEISDKSDEEVLKAYIQLNNPEFDDDDIEAEYAENYQIDEYQFDESKLKREQKKLSQRISSDVRNAKEFFESLAQEIKFPEFRQQQEVQTPQEDTEYDAMIQEQRSLYLQSLNGIENRISSLPFQWKDEKSNIAVNGKFDIPAQEVSKYRQAAEDLENYQVNRYYQDGKYQSDRLVRELYIADNFDKILTSAISQAVNQTRLEMLKQSKNIQTEQDPAGTFRPSEADEERNLFDQLFMGHLKRQ